MRRIITAALALAVLAAPVAAHHGWGSYDAGNPVTLKGALQSVDFGNPHVAATLTDAGKTWTLTLAPPSRMETRGATRDLVKAGTAVTAYGYPSRAQPNEMRAEWIEVDGKRIQLR